MNKEEWCKGKEHLLIARREEVFKAGQEAERLRNKKILSRMLATLRKEENMFLKERNEWNYYWTAAQTVVLKELLDKNKKEPEKEAEKK